MIDRGQAAKFIFRFVYVLCSAALLALTVSGCGGGAAGTNDSGGGDNGDRAAKYLASDRKAALVGRDLAQANTKFALKIFKELSKGSAGNVFISPLSVSTALSMVYNGATGETLLAMTNALNRNYQNLIGSLTDADAGVVLTLANSLWIRESFMPAVSTGFIQKLQTYFSCQPKGLDFASPDAAAAINAWISAQTGGLIKNVISSIDGSIVMFLVNAIYFKGEWAEKFDAALTAPENFTLPSGASAAVSMMNASRKLKYYEGSNFAALRLPYGRDKIAMYVFLPNAGTSVGDFIAGFTAAGCEAAMAAMAASEKRKVNVKLPKFRFEYGVKRLNDELKALGMAIAFDPDRADFSEMAPGTYIQFVDHKAVIDVNEKGSEAAAVTVIGVGLTSVPIDDTVNFTADRPFVFMICDDRSRSVLFIGKVAEPSYN